MVFILRATHNTHLSLAEEMHLHKTGRVRTSMVQANPFQARAQMCARGVRKSRFLQSYQLVSLIPKDKDCDLVDCRTNIPT